MTVSGIESIRASLGEKQFFVKAILTDSAAVFFPQGSVQHRDVKRHGASYEDDYRGNALAATLGPGRIDIRFHEGYTDERVRRLCSELLRVPEMTWAAGFVARYQGRCLMA